jgi:toxin ParE1/3/4
VRRVVWTGRAIADLAAIDAYISAFNPLAAARLSAELVAAAESLTGYPHRGRSISSKRRQLATASPYLIRYRVASDHVLILTIRHGARRPL